MYVVVLVLSSLVTRLALDFCSAFDSHKTHLADVILNCAACCLPQQAFLDEFECARQQVLLEKFEAEFDALVNKYPKAENYLLSMRASSYIPFLSCYRCRIICFSWHLLNFCCTPLKAL